MKKIILVLTAILFCTILQAQSRGSVQITGDTKVSDLVDKHIEFNEKMKTIPGWRIQIGSFSGVNSKSQAFAKKQQFIDQYPDVPIYLVFEEPNFKVKVGDFVSRLDAYVFLQKVKAAYPVATIIKDNIYPVRWNPEDFVTDDENDL